MGYTHSWTPRHTFSYFEFDRLRSAVKQIIATAALEPWSIGIEFQRDDLDEIRLNGSPLNDETEDDVCHETFCLSRVDTTYQFCKTDRKPYDTVVVACLIAAQVIALGASFSLKLSSDGDEDDWRDGFALYEATFPGLIHDRIYVGGVLFQPASVYQADLGYFANQSVPTDSLEEDSVSESPIKPLRIYWDHADTTDTFFHECASLDEAKLLLKTLDAYDKFLLSNYRSTGGVQQLVAHGSWDDITDRIAPF